MIKSPSTGAERQALREQARHEEQQARYAKTPAPKPSRQVLRRLGWKARKAESRREAHDHANRKLEAMRSKYGVWFR